MGNRSSYFAHCEQHAEESLNCPLCKLSLTSSNWKSHIAGHTSADVYLCDHCSLVFVQADELENHLTSCHADESELIDEEIEFLIEDDVKTEDILEYDEEGASFVEYIESEDTFVQPPPPKKARKSTRSAPKEPEVEKRVVKNESREDCPAEKRGQDSDCQRRNDYGDAIKASQLDDKVTTFLSTF